MNPCPCSSQEDIARSFYQSQPIFTFKTMCAEECSICSPFNFFILFYLFICGCSKSWLLCLGFSLVVVCRLFIVVASLIAELGL